MPMLRSCFFLLVVGVGWWVFAPASATAAFIYSSTNTNELSVGDRIIFTVTTMVPKGATVVPPDPSAGFGNLVVKEWNSKKYPNPKVDSIVFEYALTTYKAEKCTIPSLPYLLEDSASIDTLKTERIPLTVVPLCTIDSADIMDLKPQQTTGRPSLFALWLLLGLLLLGAGFLIGRHYYRKLRKPPPQPPPKPPYDEAMDALNALEAKQYLMKGMVREYVFELSELLKRYIERVFSINAAEFTTEEMLAWLGVSTLDKPLRASLDWFFRSTDPVKFAKYTPDRDTIDRFGAEVRSFLEATKPRTGPSGNTSPATGAPAAGETAPRLSNTVGGGP